MPIHADTNLYPGLNAHLNGFLLTTAGWKGFHAGHIEHLREEVDSLLPTGYFAESEESLQIAITNPGEDDTRSVQPDVTIFHRRVEPAAQISFPHAEVATRPDVVRFLSEVMPHDEETPSGVVIYDGRGRQPPKPVTRIEVISPGNKRPDRYAEQYAHQRSQTLRGGMALIEIDYIHHKRPLLDSIPSYRQRAEGAFPYMVLVSNPREPEADGTFALYGIGVLTPLPTIEIPLLDGAYVTLDLAKVYDRTFMSRIRRYTDELDYAADPVDFERYHPDDQARIRALLERIRGENTNS
jgi:hypothetical protein